MWNSILLLNTSIILIKPIVIVHNVLSMEERKNVWNPWYLMPKDKPRKVECKFCDNVTSYRKDRMLFRFGYQYDSNGQVGITMCSRAHPPMKALFARCGGLACPPLNNMEVPSHILDG
jgi:hypothetical protein